jgi:shikimate kinase
MAKCEKILIAGFSGAGKSSLLWELKRSSPDQEWFFDDLDQLILKGHKARDISQLVQTNGWEKFRLWERQSLEGWLKEEGKGVLALGGGALSQVVLDLFKPSRKIKFCHLDAPFEDCWNRLQGKGTEARPLINLGKDRLSEIYQDRQRIYQQIDWVLENPQGTHLEALALSFWQMIALS